MAAPLPRFIPDADRSVMRIRQGQAMVNEARPSWPLSAFCQLRCFRSHARCIPVTTRVPIDKVVDAYNEVIDSIPTQTSVVPRSSMEYDRSGCQKHRWQPL